MFPLRIRIAKIWGIPIRLDISLVILLLMFVQDYGTFYGPIVALGLLISIILHELAHSIVALHKGCRVREITLMFMGGAARMEQIPRRPLDEFLMAAAGPALSLTLGLGAVWGAAHMPLARVFPFYFNVIQWLGVINIALCLFNLMPAFPMDGGRILRAALTPKLGRLTATRIAARIGKAMAIVFGIYGFLSSPRKWTLIVIAFFLYITAGNEYRMVMMEESARMFGGLWSGIWPEAHKEENDSQGQVIISPPPYRKDRSEKADLFADDDFLD